MSFCEEYKSGYLLRIKLTPNASFCGFKGTVCDADGVIYLKAYVQTAPEKGRANDDLIKMLSKKLKIAKSNISVISGQTEHYKKIYIESPIPSLCTIIDKLAETD
ncbi:MAG: DUF167 domain-containing protein [Alphaproteobacteria bacterium]|nr:DUF167 domain-containing protein [Alphaproteobacteria bacterium]